MLPKALAAKRSEIRSRLAVTGAFALVTALMMPPAATFGYKVDDLGHLSGALCGLSLGCVPA